MPPEVKFTVLKELAKQARSGRAVRMKYAEKKIREVCSARNLDWDTMTEDERLFFITLPAKTPCFSLGDVGGLPFLW